MLRLLRLTPRRVAACGAIACGTAAAAPVLCEARVRQATSVPPPLVPRPTLQQRCAAEAIGTGIIIQVGCGVVCAAKYAGSPITPFGIAVTWGVGVALAIYATRAISGAHLNPAVSLALTAHGEFPKEEFLPYAAAQCLGAMLAGAINYATFAVGIAEVEASQGIIRGACTSTFAGAFGLVPNAALVGPIGAFIAEVWMTAVFLFLIQAIGDASKESVPSAAAPVLVGASVTALIATFGPLTGCGMNPARDLGPRFVTLLTGWGSVATTSWWIYSLGPCVGGILGVAAYKTMMQETPKA